MNKLTLNTPVSKLYMVGKTYTKRLKRLNIKSTRDLLHHYPHRWEDRSLVSEIARVQAGEEVTVQGKIVFCRNVKTSRGKKIQKAVVQDNSGQIKITWFNQPYLPKALKKGTYVSLSGEVDLFRNQRVLVSPEYEKLKDKNDQPKKTLHTGRLVPIYPETHGVSSKWLRSRIHPLIKNLVPYLNDWLPEKVSKKQGLIGLSSALRKIHFPKNREEIKQAKARLGFNELFLLQINTLLRKKRWQKNKLTNAFAVQQNKILQFMDKLPFQLTDAQKQTTKEILADLQEDKPMNRLLEGDVGSGKTVVAATAIYTCYLNNYQAAVMAPTEILTEQHFKSFKCLFTDLGIKISLITSSQVRTNFEEEVSLEDALNSSDLIIGTHALIYQKIDFQDLGLVVIDEQHRFGVQQRGKLIKKGHAPHTLTMTATPIPRTIALTMYGDLDLSVLDEMPKGRKPVKTWVVPEKKRSQAYQWIKKRIEKENEQAFVICPLIEESDKEGFENIKSVKEEYQRLENIFPKLNIGLVHGKISSEEKNAVLQQFRKGNIDILVATQVVEVGIDIPQATIIVIEDAQRFGLAQLHQLRGRVGRSNQQAYCLLFSNQQTETSKQRLGAMKKYNSGFKLAQIDLEMRGPGEIYGKKQHGWPDLKIASYTDQQLIKQTRKQAEKIIEELDKHPLLKQEIENYKMKFIEPN